MSAQDIELMADTLMELNLPSEELRLFVLRLPMIVSKIFVPLIFNKHGIDVF